MALDQITPEDLRYRLNKLKCCFAEKAAELVDKQRFGKECKDELCNLKLLGAYIEIIECYDVPPCNCYTEWVTDGSLYWTPTLTIPYGTVVKFIPRQNALPGEYLYLRWQGTTSLVPPIGVCVDGCTGFQGPCLLGLWGGITPTAWSVCGHAKEAWEARGDLIWDPLLTYEYGDIVKFMGGGPGANQNRRGEYFISIACPNPTNTGFHENGHWVELKCFRKQEI